MDKGKIFEKLMHLATNHEVKILFAPLKTNYARIYGDRIAIAQGLSIEEINHNLAHEIAHFYLHRDKGNILESEKKAEYEEQAERAADMLVELLELVG